MLYITLHVEMSLSPCCVYQLGGHGAQVADSPFQLHNSCCSPRTKQARIQRFGTWRCERCGGGTLGFMGLFSCRDCHPPGQIPEVLLIEQQHQAQNPYLYVIAFPPTHDWGADVS